MTSEEEINTIGDFFREIIDRLDNKYDTPTQKKLFDNLSDYLINFEEELREQIQEILEE